MSFIKENKDLVLFLSKIGAESLMSQAQQNIGTAQPEISNKNIAQYHGEVSEKNRDVALHFLSILQSPVQSEIGENTVAATNEDMDNFPSFLRWLARNKVIWNGQRLAWNTDESPAKDKAIFAIPRSGAPQAYVNKDLLIKYIEYLRDNQATTNQALKLKLNKLISETNTQLGAKLDVNPSPVAPTTPGAAPATAPEATPGAAAPVGPPGSPGVPDIAPDPTVQKVRTVSDQAINRIIQSLPFERDYISFRRMDDFFNEYGNIAYMNAGYLAAFRKRYDDAKGAINTISGASGSPVFNMNNIINSINNLTPSTVNRGQIIEFLDQAVNATFGAVTHFLDSYAHPPAQRITNRDQVQQIENQANIYHNLINNIERARSAWQAQYKEKR